MRTKLKRGSIKSAKFNKNDIRRVPGTPTIFIGKNGIGIIKKKEANDEHKVKKTV